MPQTDPCHGTPNRAVTSLPIRPVQLETFSSHSAFSSPHLLRHWGPLHPPEVELLGTALSSLFNHLAPGPFRRKPVERACSHNPSSQPGAHTESPVHATVSFSSPGTDAHRGAQLGCARKPQQDKATSHGIHSWDPIMAPSLLHFLGLPQLVPELLWGKQNKGRKEGRGSEARAQVDYRTYPESLVGRDKGEEKDRECGFQAVLL